MECKTEQSSLTSDECRELLDKVDSDLSEKLSEDTVIIAKPPISEFEEISYPLAQEDSKPASLFSF